ncbi:MAG: heme ABC transporter permease [Pseudomonadota bacterium]
MVSFFSNPARFEALSRTVRPWVFASALISLAAGLYLALFVSPADFKQGDSVRIIYIHVPAAWMALGAYTMITVASVVAFIWRHSLADRAALAAAPFGLAMTILALITGAVWGKPTWGAWWVWDARLTSVLVLMFIYLGYLSIWQAIDDKARAARFARIIAMVGFINIPIIKFSVDWWNTLHQPASIIRASGPTIGAAILTPLLVMILAYTLLFIWYVLTGVESQIIELRLARQPHRPVSTASPVEAMAPTAGGTHG